MQKAQILCGWKLSKNSENQLHMRQMTTSITKSQQADKQDKRGLPWKAAAAYWRQCTGERRKWWWVLRDPHQPFFGHPQKQQQTCIGQEDSTDLIRFRVRESPPKFCTITMVNAPIKFIRLPFGIFLGFTPEGLNNQKSIQYDHCVRFCGNNHDLPPVLVGRVKGCLLLSDNRA